MNKSEMNRQQLREAVGIAVGKASMCWDPRPGQQIFDAEAALNVMEDLLKVIDSYTKPLHARIHELETAPREERERSN